MFNAVVQSCFVVVFFTVSFLNTECVYMFSSDVKNLEFHVAFLPFTHSSSYLLHSSCVKKNVSQIRH